MDANGHNDGIPLELIDEDTLDSTAQMPVAVRPDLAAKYVKVARFVASVSEPDALAAFLPSEDDPRLDELRKFLVFITKGWPSGISFYFFPKMKAEIRALHRHEHRDGAFPELLFGKPTSIRKPKGEIIPVMFFCPYTSCGRGKRGDFPSLRKQMGKLLLLNAMGWDVYGCANPILYRCRIQRAIPAIHNLLAESDDSSLEEQEETIRMMKSVVGAVVFSGNKSYHQYYRLRAPIRNPHCVTSKDLDELKPTIGTANGRKATSWDAVQSLKRAARLSTITVEPFKYAADLLRGLILERGGIQLCSRPLFNFSGLSRVPGFVHAGSGRLSSLDFLDDNAAMHDNGTCEPDDVKYSPYWRKEFGIPDDEVFPPKHRKMAAPTPSSFDGIDPNDSPRQEEGKVKEEGSETGTGTTPIDPLPTDGISKGGETLNPTGNKGGTPPVFSPGQTFLEDLADFEKLKVSGIQCQGTRRSLHRVVVNVALIQGWTKQSPDGKDIVLDADRIADEWRTVLVLSGNSIRCSVEEGVSQMVGYVGVKNRGRRDGHRRFTLPDCALLPDIDGQRKNALRERILRLVVQENGRRPASRSAEKSPKTSIATGIANIVMDILYPKIKALPAQCQVGKLAIPVKDMRAKCPRSKFAPTREWLYRLNVIKPTQKANHAAGLTRLYWVNIPLVIWLLGFKKGELTWERHTAKLKDEASSSSSES